MTSSSFEEMKDFVLTYPKLKERMDLYKQKHSDDCTKKIIKNLKSIYADFSPQYLKGFEKVLDLSLSQMYDGINLNQNGLDLKSLFETHNVVLVPNHQSHADYLMINYRVYKDFGVNLYVAGGENLNIFPIGSLFRKSGCFFIRRSFQNDILYKLTLEGYLYYLLSIGAPIEFFFEGGRSRSGKLLPPKYGLYQMLIESHKSIPDDKKRDLVFLPVSIVHEYVPEQKTLTSELGGAKKIKESSGQLLGLLKLVSKQFGSVHITLGLPVFLKNFEQENPKKLTQDLAIECFRRVGKNMALTPMSLLSLALLDDSSASFRWEDICHQSELILRYCRHFKVPVTTSLQGHDWEDSIGRALDILIANKKLEVIGKRETGQIFYSLKKEARPEILYFKNTIVHHFLVPWTISSAWMALFNGSIENVDDLKRLLLAQRNQLKQEFYLPSVKEFMESALAIISHMVGKPITGLRECFDFSPRDYYNIASEISVFSRMLSYINEAYLIGAQVLKMLHIQGKKEIFFEDYKFSFKDLFKYESELGRTIKYPESCSLELMRSTLKFFVHQRLLENKNGAYVFVNPDEFDEIILKYEKQLVQQLHFCIRI